MLFVVPGIVLLFTIIGIVLRYLKKEAIVVPLFLALIIALYQMLY